MACLEITETKIILIAYRLIDIRHLKIVVTTLKIKDIAVYGHSEIFRFVSVLSRISTLII